LNELIKEFFYLLVEEFFFIGGIIVAENLLYYGFSRGQDNSVEEVIDRADNLIKASSKNEMKEFLEELKDMKSRVEQKEFYFY
jgi:hypothetical protein